MNQSSMTPGHGGSSTMKWLLIILVLVIVLGGGYLVYAKYGKSSTSTTASPSPVAAVSVSPSAAVGPTASSTSDLTTYNNSQYGFSFQYLKSANLQAIDINTGVALKKDLNSPGVLSIQTEVTNGKTLDQLVQDKEAGRILEGPQKITFAGKSAYEGVDQGMVSYYGIYVVNGDKLYTLSFDTNDKATLAELKSGLSDNQKMMISTFQFTP